MAPKNLYQEVVVEEDEELVAILSRERNPRTEPSRGLILIMTGAEFPSPINTKWLFASILQP